MEQDPQEPRRSFQVVALGSLGTILLAGGGSAVAARPWAAEELGALPYALGVAGVAAVVLAALVVLRLLKRWPFEGANPAPDGVASYLAAACAGLGAGAYAGLLHHASTPVHYGTLIAYLGFLPFAVVVVAVTTTRFRSVAARIVTLLAATEVGAQLGLHYVKGRAGWWPDITAFNLVYAAGALGFLGLVTVVSAALRWAFPRRAETGDASSSPSSPP